MDQESQRLLNSLQMTMRAQMPNLITKKERQIRSSPPKNREPALFDLMYHRYWNLQTLLQILKNKELRKLKSLQ